MSKPNGGPAFPQIRPYDEHETGGMSLRDYFAASAVQGILASPRPPKTSDRDNVMSGELADLAYAVADAMLAKREKP